MGDFLQRNRRRLILAGIALAASVAASIADGTPPPPLSDIALGWPALLHLERAAAMLLLGGGVAVICWRATAGDLPIRFANVEYESNAATDLAVRQASQERRLRRLEVTNELRPEPELVDEPDES